MFHSVWPTYDMDHAEAANSMVGAQGIIKDRPAPSGFIRVRGELWQAEVMGDALFGRHRRILANLIVLATSVPCEELLILAERDLAWTR